MIQHSQQTPVAVGSNQRHAEKTRDAGSRKEIKSNFGVTAIIKALIQDIRSWLRMEVELAKAEVKESITKAGRSIGMIVGGAFIAFSAFIVLLLLMSAGIGVGLYSIGLSPITASLSSLGIVVLLTASAAWILISRGVDGLSSENLKPDQTQESLKDMADTVKNVGKS